MIREWIVFALCLGAGGHLALAFVIHSPESWPWPRAGVTGLLMGFGLYAVVQGLRLLWRLLRPAQPNRDDIPRRDPFAL